MGSKLNKILREEKRREEKRREEKRREEKRREEKRREEKRSLINLLTSAGGAV